MDSVPHPDLNETPRVALYARVSTEDQAERQTVQGQLDFLRKLADLHGWPIAGEYVDDGAFGTVLLYRLDRLGRKTRVLLDAHEALERHAIALKSATEPFDTSTPIGT